eukprot:c20708_g2_i1 orf=2-229(-)
MWIKLVTSAIGFFLTFGHYLMLHPLSEREIFRAALKIFFCSYYVSNGRCSNSFRLHSSVTQGLHTCVKLRCGTYKS